MGDEQRFLVGVHFRRHFGGPGHLTVSHGRLVLTDRRARRTLVQTEPVVAVERKRWEPPTGNHWITITDGTTTAFVTASRRRAERVLAAVAEAGFDVRR